MLEYSPQKLLRHLGEGTGCFKFQVCSLFYFLKINSVRGTRLYTVPSGICDWERGVLAHFVIWVNSVSNLLDYLSIGEWRYGSTIFDLGIRWWWVVSITRRTFYIRGKTFRTHWIWGWMGTRAGLDAVKKGKTSCPCRPACSPLLFWQTEYIFTLIVLAYPYASEVVIFTSLNI
jgi:hypothetical protein